MQIRVVFPPLSWTMRGGGCLRLPHDTFCNGKKSFTGAV